MGPNYASGLARLLIFREFYVFFAVEHGGNGSVLLLSRLLQIDDGNGSVIIAGREQVVLDGVIVETSDGALGVGLDGVDQGWVFLRGEIW